MRGGRLVNIMASSDSHVALAHPEEISMLKMRRNKKNFTAAQVQGKVTGRWTEEEHERFNEGKSIQIFPDMHKFDYVIVSHDIIRLTI